MFIASVITVAKTWKQPQCPSADLEIKRLCSIHTMEYYTALKRNEVLIQITTWMNLEDSVLSERSQTQKATYCVILLTWKVQNRQVYRDRKQISVSQELGARRMGSDS